MLRIVLLALMMTGLLLAGAGCEAKKSGSREFIPGKGWTPTD